VVCRCEKVTEAEIVEAIRRGATTLDGVKFRTRAGMGRCQANYCGPEVARILARELNQPVEQISKKGPGSCYIGREGS
jgi:glycerol-3-phosphate dehydrogenase